MRQEIDDKHFRFLTSLRTRFTEVDLQGVVHHSEIVKYLEIARIEYWRNLGIGYREFRQFGYEYVVSKLECNYLKPLYFDNLITIKARISRITRTSITFDYLIYDQDNVLAIDAHILLVCMQIGRLKPCPIPAEYLKKVIGYEKPGSIDLKAGKAFDTRD